MQGVSSVEGTLFCLHDAPAKTTFQERIDEKNFDLAVSIFIRT